ncbi:uncharacterized protein K02A2.6-like [Galendromus occidentalis]|uniref:RNA-directed DNA polymerase n=1 Tax=Galendromus occidentalis TaxID=34638 RepID=A0AAJ6VX68_9ACAR|nr:uncharacterized protein K02A2.6-like [Galendromus occidentalis]
MKNKAKGSVYWPSIDADIEAFVRQCHACQENAPSLPKELMIISEIPSLPWQTVAADIFEFDGSHYQVVVDHYSVYFEIQKLSNITSKTLIQACFSCFAHFGIPKTMRVDNGRQYASFEFRKTMKEAVQNLCPL